MRALIVSVMVLVLSCVDASLAWADSANPRETIQVTIERAKQLVRNEKQNLSETELTKKLEEIIFPAFDFREMSRRCLGANWNSGTKEQQTEFVDLFSAMLSENYRDKVLSGIETSNVTIDNARQGGKRALVRTTIKSEDESIAVDYRMQKNTDGWKVYDVIIENVGLVTNYRNEFAGIIRAHGFDGLLKRLREKRKD